jgi:hypothetical protein
VLKKHQIQEAVFFSDKARFTIIRHTQTTKITDTDVKQIPTYCIKFPLCDLKIRAWCAVSVCQVTQPRFFEETNTNYYIQIILTPLLRRLTEKYPMHTIHFLCKDGRTVFKGKLSKFQNKSFITFQEIFSEHARPV